MNLMQSEITMELYIPCYTKNMNPSNARSSQKKNILFFSLLINLLVY